MSLNVYTDGCCKGNPGRGGFGIVIRYINQDKEISKGFKLTTNSRMELMAAVEAFKNINEKDYSEIKLFTDSKYVALSINNGWLNKWKSNGWRTSTRKPVKNRDLFEEFYDQIHKFKKVDFVWVKGHADNKYNNRCDEIANYAANGSILEDDKNYKNDG